MSCRSPAPSRSPPCSRWHAFACQQRFQHVEAAYIACGQQQSGRKISRWAELIPTSSCLRQALVEHRLGARPARAPRSPVVHAVVLAEFEALGDVGQISMGRSTVRVAQLRSTDAMRVRTRVSRRRRRIVRGPETGEPPARATIKPETDLSAASGNSRSASRRSPRVEAPEKARAARSCQPSSLGCSENARIAADESAVFHDRQPVCRQCVPGAVAASDATESSIAANQSRDGQRPYGCSSRARPPWRRRAQRSPSARRVRAACLRRWALAR